jgi:alpha-mannosidase
MLGERSFEAAFGPCEIKTFRVPRDPRLPVTETDLLELPLEEDTQEEPEPPAGPPASATGQDGASGAGQDSASGAGQDSASGAERDGGAAGG